MAHRYYDLPSLGALAAFEAAARHGSVKLAAEELNVTPGAVSRQIKAVEQHLEVPLFLRNGKGMALTAAGQELFHVLAGTFSKTSEVIRGIRQQDGTRTVALASSDAFASLWLIPQMPDFWRQHPEVNVDHVIWESARNHRRHDVELRIRYGTGTWPDEHAEPLFGEYVYPVCSPAFARQNRADTAADLAHLPLLNVEWVEHDWLGWDEMLRRAGAPSGALHTRRIGKFSVALQAAMADQGLVIGWHRLVAPLIAQGALCRFGEVVMATPGAYYLTRAAARTLSPAARTLRDWVHARAELERARPLTFTPPGV